LQIENTVIAIEDSLIYTDKISYPEVVAYSKQKWEKDDLEAVWEKRFFILKKNL